MAISVASYTNIDSGWFSTTTPRSISGLSWSAGDIVVIIGGSENDVTTLSNPTNANLTIGAPKADGGAPAGVECTSYVWVSDPAASGQTGQAIVCAAGGGQQWGCAAWVISGLPSGFANATTNITESAISRTVSAGSIVCYGLFDFNATNPPGKTPLAGGGGTTTERLDQGNGSTYAQYLYDEVGTSAGTFNFGPNNYTSLRVNQVIVEILASTTAVQQEGFRFRNDDGDEDAATWRQTQDVADEAELDEQVRLRMLLNATGDPASTQYRLEYKEDSEAAGLWRAIGVGAPGSTPTVVGSGSAALSTNDPSVDLSSGSWTPAEDDVVVFFIASTTVLDLVVDGSLPSGWFGVLGSGVDVNSDAHGYCAIYHVVTSGEAGGSTTFTATNALAAAETGNVVALAIRGVDPAAVIHKAGSTFDSGAVTPSVLAALTGANQPTLSDCLVVRGVSQDSTGTYTTPGAHTSQALNNTNQVNQVFTRDAATTAASDVAAVNVTPDAGDEYCSITIAFTPPLGTPAVTFYTSSNYADGDATTFQLAAPSGKSTSDFDAGVMVEGQALADAVNITADDYTEIEWALMAQTPAVTDDVYEFRVTANGAALDTYTVTPELTIVEVGDTDVPATTVTASVAVFAPTITASGNVTTTVVTGVAVVNAPTIRVDATVTTVTVTGVAVVNAPTITASGNLTTAIVTGIAVVPTPTITASGNVTATVVDGVVVVNTPSIVTENTTTVSATTVTAAAVVPTPTITASGNVTTTTVTAAAVVNTPVVSVSTTATAAVVTGVAVVNAPTITASGNVTTTTVTGVAVVDTPTISASVTVTPTTVTGVAIVNAPNISSAVTPTTVTGVVEIFTPDITTADTTTINATTVTGVAVVNAPTITASGNVTTTTVTGLVVVDTPTISLSYTALAATVTALAVVNTPTITASATVTPTTVTGVGSVESPTASASVTVTPTTVTGVGVVNAPNISSTVTPTTVTGVVEVPTPSVSTDSSANANAVVVTAVGSVGAPTITATGDTSPAVVTAAAQIPTPTIVVSVTVTATEVVATVVIPTPGASASEFPLPPVIDGVIVIPTPTVLTTVVITPTTVTATVVIPTPAIVGISVPGTLVLELVMATLLLNVVSETLTLSVE